MSDRQKQNEIFNFKQTIARLNQNIRIDEITPLDKHVLETFNNMSELAKVTILMSCCLSDKTYCNEGVTKQAHPIEFFDLKNSKLSQTKEELTDIEKANQIELIRLKTWAMKMVLSLMSGLVLIGAFTAFVSAKDPSGFISQNTNMLLEIIKIVFF